MTENLSKATRFEIHSVLKQANYDLGKHQLNTVASAAMKVLNALERFEGRRNAVTEEGLSILCGCSLRSRRTSAIIYGASCALART
jgi:leucyl-tRNA synthetase